MKIAKSLERYKSSGGSESRESRESIARWSKLLRYFGYMLEVASAHLPDDTRWNPPLGEAA